MLSIVYISLVIDCPCRCLKQNEKEGSSCIMSSHNRIERCQQTEDRHIRVFFFDLRQQRFIAYATSIKHSISTIKHQPLPILKDGVDNKNQTAAQEWNSQIFARFLVCFCLCSLLLSPLTALSLVKSHFRKNLSLPISQVVIFFESRATSITLKQRHVGYIVRQ